ncbi:MAG: hypothetical protein V1875_06470 [Candidatus Altiarchaeota archaeon]
MSQKTAAGQAGERQRDLTEYITGLTDPADRITVIVRPGDREKVKGKLISAGIPKDRIDTPTAEEFDPRGNHLLVVADVENIPSLRNAVTEKGADVAIALIVPKGDYKEMSKKAGHPLIHTDMSDDRAEEVLTDGIMTVLDGRMPATMPPQMEGFHPPNETDYIGATKAKIGGRKILVNGMYGFTDAERWFGPMTEMGRIVWEPNTEKAEAAILSNPGEYALVVSTNPDTLKRIKAQPRCGHICRGYQSFQRYNDHGGLVTEGAATEAHFATPSNLHESTDYLARFIMTGFEMMEGGKNLKSPDAGERFSWAFGVK